MGRPPSLSVEQQDRVRELAAEGVSLRAIAEQVGSSKDAVRRVLLRDREMAGAATSLGAGRASKAGSDAGGARGVSGAVGAAEAFPNRVTRLVADDRRPGVTYLETHRTRPVRVAGRVVEVDEEGRVYCDGCLAWLPLREAVAAGHRAVPGIVRPGVLASLSDADHAAMDWARVSGRSRAWWV